MGDDGPGRTSPKEASAEGEGGGFQSPNVQGLPPPRSAAFSKLIIFWGCRDGLGAAGEEQEEPPRVLWPGVLSLEKPWPQQWGARPPPGLLWTSLSPAQGSPGRTLSGTPGTPFAASVPPASSYECCFPTAFAVVDAVTIRFLLSPV